MLHFHQTFCGLKLAVWFWITDAWSSKVTHCSQWDSRQSLTSIEFPSCQVMVYPSDVIRLRSKNSDVSSLFFFLWKYDQKIFLICKEAHELRTHTQTRKNQNAKLKLSMRLKKKIFEISMSQMLHGIYLY